MTIPREPAFDQTEYQNRLQAVQRSIADRFDGILLFGPQNVYYLCGMDSENLFDYQCLVVPSEGPPTLVIFELEKGRAENSSWLNDVVTFSVFDDPVVITVDVLRRRKIDSGRLGIERRTGLTPVLEEKIKAALSAASFEDAFGIVEELRLRKSPRELEYMREAAALTDQAVEAGYAVMRPGRTDNEIAAAIMSKLYEAGSETVCWGPIVATGYRSGIAHSTFNGRRVEPGDCIFLEVTGERCRYTAPLMRTAVLGDPTPQMRRVAEAGEEAIATILRTAAPGVLASDVARAGLAVLEPVLKDVVFHHYFGYPVGIGYPPTWIESLGYFLQTDNPRPLERGMTFHLPISLRRYGEFGVNLSHTIAITEGGCEPLTTTDAQLQVLSL
jgi:Xaa-Pro dipeptidase